MGCYYLDLGIRISRKKKIENRQRFAIIHRYSDSSKLFTFRIYVVVFGNQHQIIVVVANL